MLSVIAIETTVDPVPNCLFLKEFFTKMILKIMSRWHKLHTDGPDLNDQAPKCLQTRYQQVTCRKTDLCTCNPCESEKAELIWY